MSIEGRGSMRIYRLNWKKNGVGVYSPEFDTEQQALDWARDNIPGITTGIQSKKVEG